MFAALSVNVPPREKVSPPEPVMAAVLIVVFPGPLIVSRLPPLVMPPVRVSVSPELDDVMVARCR